VKLRFSLALPVILPSLALAQQQAPGATAADSNAPAASVAAVSLPTLEPLTPEQKVKRRALRLIEPVTLVSSAFGAGIAQWRDIPPQWGQGAEGYAKRFGEAEGFTAVHNTVALGFDLGFHLDPRYHRMPDAKFMPRLRNAVMQSFLAWKDSGGRMINVSEIGGNMAAGLVANTWEPRGYNSWGDGLERGALGLLYHTGKNVAREFLPDLMHRGKKGPYTASVTD
jgi:hypothetical protein